MDEKGYSVLGKKSKTAKNLYLGVIIFSFCMVFIGILVIILTNNLLPFIIYVVPLFALFVIMLVLYIRDKRRPEEIVFLSDDKKRIKVYANGRFYEIELSKVIYARHINGRSRTYIFNFGSLVVGTSERKYYINNVDDVDEVWYQIKKYSDK